MEGMEKWGGEGEKEGEWKGGIEEKVNIFIGIIIS